ncbi:extracellular solute-binding protein [Clostridium sp. 'deep sea']|uniref:extracellular solute-binding protein n=1 Tax=Clostridium sp. 'deep sea' TaxID=2779445 RepID=UPI0018965347|nr:extracellular solute-binding protein [Clostridium sp. 'deep sea']QOR35422.1 extracellular solute-binding protein [Clostridium sp. 'deep sea']
MKKLVGVLISVLVISLFAGCSNQQTLYVLNWGEYMSTELIEKFESETGVKVVTDEVDSNEVMYEKIKSGNTAYDIAIPSEYMIQKLASENLLNTVDKTMVPNLSENTLEPIVANLMKQAKISDNAVPYFYGCIGIMYRNEYESLVKEHGFRVLFDRSILPDDTKVGMYNSGRDSVSAALLHLGYDVNTTDTKQLTEAEELLKNMDYTLWGDDNLKREIIAGNLDIALVYSGDFFDSYYVVLDEGDELTFNFMTPLSTNIWVDAMIIPTTSKNIELAHKFVNFFLDADNVLTNVDSVGYTPVVSKTYEKMKADSQRNDITGHSYFRDIYFHKDFKGQMYKNLTSEHYQQLEEILMRAKQ